MSNDRRITDKYDDVHFKSDRFFFADNKWHYYLRTYDGGATTIGGFNSKAEASAHCNARFENKIDFFFGKDK